MSKSKTKWMAFDDLPDEVKPLAVAYNNTVSRLHHTCNVIRLASTDGRLFIQRYGWLYPAVLAELEKAAGCYVEVEALAPKYLLIKLFGGVPPRANPISRQSDTPSNFLFREMV